MRKRATIAPLEHSLAFIGEVLAVSKIWMFLT